MSIRIPRVYLAVVAALAVLAALAIGTTTAPTRSPVTPLAVECPNGTNWNNFYGRCM